MSGRLDGRVALVTGGGSGIGAAACRGLAKAGAAVAVTDLSPEAALSVADSIQAYVWGLRWKMKLEHQADPVLGVMHWQEFMRSVRVKSHVG